MAIKLDGNVTTALELHASDGTIVTKQLTEELNLQNKNVAVNGEVTADAGYDGLGVVTVAVSGGGSSDIITPWFTIKTAEVEVGANTAENAHTIIGYFEGLYGEGNILAIYLKDSSASYVDNQLVSLNCHLVSNTSISQPQLWDAYRMKNNIPATFQPTTGYGCVIPQGATYVVQYYTNKI